MSMMTAATIVATVAPAGATFVTVVAEGEREGVRVREREREWEGGGE